MSHPAPAASNSVADRSPFLDQAAQAARSAGALLREHYEGDLAVNETADHDIKLEMDVRSQDLITAELLAAFPDHAIYGEEGLAGNQESDYHWIVDPIDGTVNYYFGIPHFCVSIALREKEELIAGAIYDPMMDELWTVDSESEPRRNDLPVRVSERASLREAVLTVGFSKTKASIDAGLERYKTIAYQVRKTRMMGSAALALAYVACGRLDAYIEESVSLWDIAAGKLLVERAGGSVRVTPHPEIADQMSVVASNGRLPLDEV